MENLITCYNCRLRFNRQANKPKFLTCHHVMCLSCCKHYYRDGKIVCQNCHSRTYVTVRRIVLEDEDSNNEGEGGEAKMTDEEVTALLDRELQSNLGAVDAAEYFEKQQQKKNENQVNVGASGSGLQSTGSGKSNQSSQDSKIKKKEKESSTESSAESSDSSESSSEEESDQSTSDDSDAEKKKMTKKAKGISKFGSVAEELRGKFTGGGRKKEKEKGLRKTKFKKTVFLCAKANTFEIPKSSEEKQMKRAGLGLKTVAFDQTDSSKNIKSKIKRAYPRLASLDFCYCQQRSTGGKNLLEEKHREPNGKEIKAMKKMIYLVPVKKTLNYDSSKEGKSRRS